MKHNNVLLIKMFNGLGLFIFSFLYDLQRGCRDAQEVVLHNFSRAVVVRSSFVVKSSFYSIVTGFFSVSFLTQS